MSRIAGTCSAAQRRSSGRPFITSSTTGVPVATTACSSSSWRPGSSSDDREAPLADHVLPLADHHDRDVGAARRGRPPARARPRRRTPPGPPARCRRTCRTSTGRRAAPGARRARSSTRTPRPRGAGCRRARSPSRRGRSRSTTARACRAGESASGPITAIDPSARRSSGSRPPSLRSSTADRSAATRATSRCAGSASTSRARSSSTYGSSNRPSAELRLEHAPHARVERLLADRRPAPAPRAGGRRRGRRSPSPCRRRRSAPRAAGVGQVGGEAVRHQVAHGVGVADHEALEAPARRAAPR